MPNKEQQDVSKGFVGSTIDSITLESNNVLRLRFGYSSVLKFRDDGQSCCEHRYMHTDDDLKYYNDAKFLGYEVESGPTEEGDWEYRESQFLKIHTSKGTFTVVNYNEHNGYYGGFCLVVEGSTRSWEDEASN